MGYKKYWSIKQEVQLSGKPPTRKAGDTLALSMERKEKKKRAKKEREKRKDREKSLLGRSSRTRRSRSIHLYL
jgi:hypothetical protein